MEYKVLKRLIIFLFLVPVFIQAQSLPLLITEIMYNPEGNDTDHEWFEVFNQSNQTFYLKSGRSGWRINDGENHLFNDEITIYPQEVFVIVQDKNKFLNDYPDFKGKIVSANFSLKNTSGKIQIFNENKDLLTEVSYQQSCGGDGNGYSIIFKDGFCQENKVKKGTPGVYPDMTQIITDKTQTTTDKVQTTTDKTQTTTDKVQTTTDKTPTYTDLTPTSSPFNSFESMSSSLESPSTSQALAPNTYESQDIPNLYISEFLPNPQGNDYNQEFVELYNYGDEEVSLDGFVLEIGKKRIKLKGTIEPKEYFVITNKDYNFSIRNQGENLTLYYKNEKIFSISYNGKAPEGKSFSRFEDNWQFTQPTPGKENILVLDKKEGEIKENFEKETPQTALINKPPQIKERNNALIFLGTLISIVILSILIFILL